MQERWQVVVTLEFAGETNHMLMGGLGKRAARNLVRRIRDALSDHAEDPQRGKPYLTVERPDGGLAVLRYSTVMGVGCRPEPVEEPVSEKERQERAAARIVEEAKLRVKQQRTEKRVAVS